MKSPVTFIFFILLLSENLLAQQSQQVYLSGTDKDRTVLWDFFCTKGQNSGKWTKIPVPSQWESQGFGKYAYGYDNRKDSTLSDEQGLYKKSFEVLKSWTGKRIFLVFEGVMTDTEVKVNGKSAGEKHQGGFYRFLYEITDLTKTGKNLLEVTVSESSSDKSVNRAEREGDYWTFGGIYRPVYLEIVPQSHISRVAVDAKADGSFYMDVYTSKIKAGSEIEAQIQELNGKNIGNPFIVKTESTQDKISLSSKTSTPALWSPEFPNLYQVKISLKEDGNIIHTLIQRFGFRTVELRKQDGIYVNGAKIILKGADRHSFYPKSGRTLSKDISLLDVKLMKEMNINAVRMSHYPPDQHFLDVCDSLGLFVLDELGGWQRNYDTIPGRKLVKELVTRDVNHPSIIIWDNANEGGWNRGLDNDFAIYDPQKRIVIHPWERFNGTDTKHYPNYNYLANSTLYSQDIFFPTEFMHGLYDGGHGAGLDDFWNLMLQYPYNAGGFLWSFHDEGVVRTDKNNIIDTYKNSAPDGIVGPYREKEASFYTIKEIWSPVYIAQKNITPLFDGKLQIENRYIFTNLNQCAFEWKLVSFSKPGQPAKVIINKSQKLPPFTLNPHEKGLISLNLPENWQNNDALYLTAYDPYQQEIFTWSWAITSPRQNAQKNISPAAQSVIETTESEKSVIVKANNIAYYFDKTTGYLQKVVNTKSEISLSGGPVLAGVKQQLKKFTHYQENKKYVVSAEYEGNGFLNVVWTFDTDKPAQLHYIYSQKGDADFMGITFNYPEDKITGMNWLGRGPYRVWKNRLKGMLFGVWHKDYNNTITGESWLYPEFKGYHSEMHWITIETKEAPFTIYTENEQLFFQMLKPENPKGAFNNNTNPAFPEGNIGFLNAISPIGTKFQDAAQMGPQSQKNSMLNYTPVQGILWFDFR
jgi:hypothetical protein